MRDTIRSSDSTVSRRAVAKGVAWAAPTIVLASAAPAFAVSPFHVWFESLGLACKTPGASCEKDTGITKGYVVRVRVCHDAPFPMDIIIRDATVSLAGGASTLWQVKAVAASVNCPSTIATVGTVPDPQAGQDPDVILHMVAAPLGGEVCCVIDFGIEGEPNSANVSISGSAPYEWTAIGAPAPLYGLQHALHVRVRNPALHQVRDRRRTEPLIHDNRRPSPEGSEEGRRLRVAQDASAAFTLAATTDPSARPFARALTALITWPMARIPAPAPTAATSSATIASTSPSVSGVGR